MAAIDKIYVNSYQEFKKFEEWCLKQPKLKDKYGKEVSITSYLFYGWDNPKYWPGNHPIFSAPYYVDAYIIRNCPLDYIQKELMINYGHKTQEDINEMYQTVLNRTKEDQELIDNDNYPNKPISYWWLSLSDFSIVNGVVTMPHLEKSDYQKILDNELYNSPSTNKFTRGKHFKIIKLPFYQFKCNYPIRRNRRQPYWDIDLKLPNGEFMWWSDNGIIGTWDFPEEFVESKWSCSHTHCKSLKAIKRRIIKWKLPVGTIVRLSGRYVGETYEIIVKK